MIILEVKPKEDYTLQIVSDDGRTGRDIIESCGLE